MATKQAKSPALDVVPPDEVDALVTRVRAEKAIPRKKALALKLSPRGEVMLRDALAQRDLDAGKKYFRVPLARQLQQTLEAQGSIALSALKKAVVGLEAGSELKDLVGDLLRQKQARLVLEQGKPTLVRFSTPVLTLQALTDALSASEALVKLLRAGKAGARKSPALGLPVAEVRARLDAATALLGAPALASAPSGSPPAPATALYQKLEALSSPDRPLVFIPALIDALEPAGPERVVQLLLEAHREGRVELRPDSGVNLLSAAQLAQCPRGPAGTPLSYVRLIPTRGSA
jgi:hypothetical protein